jgi:hypothetical protein
LAIDNQTYVSRPETSVLLSSKHRPIGKVGVYQTPSYNKLVCNKIRMVKDILHDCQVDVVFSDVDNVFLRDPFQHDLGRMILSQKYDYIYQVNDASTSRPKDHSCMTEGQSVGEGNTGFHYFRSNKRTHGILEETLRRCDNPSNQFNDQAIFWGVMREAMNKDKTWKHCPSHDYRNLTKLSGPKKHDDNDVAVLCCLDPYFYRTAQQEPPQREKADLVAYHANFAVGTARKELKLREWVDGGWRLGNLSKS